MNDNTIAAMKLALEALELYVPKEDYENKPVGNVMDALRAALAEKQAKPVQEPVVWTLTKTLNKRETTTNGHL